MLGCLIQNIDIIIIQLHIIIYYDQKWYTKKLNKHLCIFSIAMYQLECFIPNPFLPTLNPPTQ